MEILPTWYGGDDFTNNGCNCCPNIGRGIDWSAHGMGVKKIKNPENCSATMDSFGYRDLTDSIEALWSVQRFNQYIGYEDSVRAATGCIDPVHVSLDSQSHTLFFLRHFGFVIDSIHPNGKIEAHGGPCANPPILAKAAAGVQRQSQGLGGGRFGSVPDELNPIQLQVAPNPLRRSTTVCYTVPLEDADDLVDLKVYNMLVQDVSNLVHDVQATGKHSVQFNAADLPSGRYIVACHLRNHQQSKLMIVTH